MILGLTGGIASGKTQATNFFQKLGICIVDADEISRNISKPDTPSYKAICQKFPQFCIDGNLDRKALRDEISNNQASKNWLEELLHPQVLAKIEQELAKGNGAYKILSSPLLFELPALRKMVDRVLLIDVSEQEQIVRASKRDGVSAKQIADILKIQMSRAEKIALADDIIDNSGDLNELEQAVKSKHSYYLQILQKN